MTKAKKSMALKSGDFLPASAAARRIYSIAWRVTHDGYTMIQPLPIDVFGDPKAHYIGARYIPGFAYVTTPIQWRESSQIPTFGKLTGEFTDMLKERMFPRCLGVRESWRGDRPDRAAECGRSVQR